MCAATVYSKKAATVISYCKDCATFYVWHNNLMLCFDSEQLKTFRKFSDGVNYDELSHEFPDGTERMILRTPNRDINFVFTLQEWHYFQQAMDEALYMLEVYSIIER